VSLLAGATAFGASPNTYQITPYKTTMVPDAEWQAYLHDLYSAHSKLCQLTFDKQDELRRSGGSFRNLGPQQIAITEKYDEQTKAAQGDLSAQVARQQQIQMKFAGRPYADAFATILYVLNPDASNFSSAWPLQASGAGESLGYNAVAIGDVDGDGFPEIVTVLNTHWEFSFCLTNENFGEFPFWACSFSPQLSSSVVVAALMDLSPIPTAPLQAPTS
jgi:hypothetical protein